MSISKSMQSRRASIARKLILASLTAMCFLAMGCAQSKFVSVAAETDNSPLAVASPSPTDPSAEPTPGATPDPTATPPVTATPSPSPVPTATPSASPTPVPTPTPTATPPVTATPAPTPKPTPKPTPPTSTSVPLGRGPNIKWGCGMKAGTGTGQSTFDAIQDKTVTMRLTPSSAVQAGCVKTAGVYQSMDQYNEYSYSELPLSYCGAMADGDYTLTLTDSSGNNLTLTDPLETIHYLNGNYVIQNSVAYQQAWYPWVYYGVTSNSVGVNYSQNGFEDGCDSP